MASLVVHNNEMIGLYIPIESDSFAGMGCLYDYMEVKPSAEFSPSLGNFKLTGSAPIDLYIVKGNDGVFRALLSTFSDEATTNLDPKGEGLINVLFSGDVLTKIGLYSVVDGVYFAIAAVGEEGVNYLETIYKEINEGNVALFYSLVDEDHSKYGINLFLIDKVPSEFTDEMKSIGESKSRLHSEFNSTGIVQKLYDNKKEWVSLSPRWVDESEEDIIIWLKPRDSKYNSGWFSVNDLLLWIEEKGPVVIGDSVEN